MAKTELQEEALQLPPEERIELAQVLWESVSAEDEVRFVPIREWQKEALADALADLDQNPDDYETWEQVKARTLAGRMRLVLVVRRLAKADLLQARSREEHHLVASGVVGAMKQLWARLLGPAPQVSLVDTLKVFVEGEGRPPGHRDAIAASIRMSNRAARDAERLAHPAVAIRTALRGTGRGS